MAVPSFLSGLGPSKQESAVLADALCNRHAAYVWLRDIRANCSDEIAHDEIGKALYYELKHRCRRNVVEDLRGAFNRYRARVEKVELEAYLNGG